MTAVAPFKIRPATDQDGDGIAAIILAAFDEHPGCIFDRTAEFPELDQVSTYFSEQGGRFWVAENTDGRIVGSCGFLPAPGNGVELHKVYLDQSARGSGLARDLLELAEKTAQEQGAGQVILWTDTRFLSGQRFYEKNGYSRQPETRQLDDLSHSEEFNYIKVF